MELLPRIKAALTAEYGDRLKGVVLYGSTARGEAERESDIDLLVILDGPFQLGKELETIIHALYPLQLEVLRPIHAMPVSEKDYMSGEYALYRNARREGIPA